MPDEKVHLIPGEFLRETSRLIRSLRNCKVILQGRPYNQLVIDKQGNRAYLNIGSIGELCECGPAPGFSCGPLDIQAGDCVSRTGGGSLRGWSKYQNPNVGDKNLLKFTQIIYTASVSPFIMLIQYMGSGCSTFVCNADILTILNSLATWDVSSNALASDAAMQRNSCNGISVVTIQLNEPRGFTVFNTIFGSLGLSEGAISDLLYRSTYNSPGGGCSSSFDTCCIGGSSSYFDAGNTMVLDANLGAPDTVDAALQRASVTPGTSCITSPGSFDSTTAESTGELSFTGATSVTVPLQLTGVTPGTYNFKVDAEIYDLSDVYQNDEEIDVTIELDSSDISVCVASYDYPVPIRDGEKVKFIAVRDLVAA